MDVRRGLRVFFDSDLAGLFPFGRTADSAGPSLAFSAKLAAADGADHAGSASYFVALFRRHRRRHSLCEQRRVSRPRHFPGPAQCGLSRRADRPSGDRAGRWTGSCGRHRRIGGDPRGQGNLERHRLRDLRVSAPPFDRSARRPHRSRPRRPPQSASRHLLLSHRRAALRRCRRHSRRAYRPDDQGGAGGDVSRTADRPVEDDRQPKRVSASRRRRSFSAERSTPMSLRQRVLSSLRRSFADENLPLRLAFWDGDKFDFTPAPTVTIALRSPSLLRFLLTGQIGKLADAYIRGDLEVEGPIEEILAVGIRLAERIGKTSPLLAIASALHRLRRGGKKADAANIRHHYDISNEFYALWLDRTMTYSCAYFRRGDEDIDIAQAQKLEHICRKLRLAPGQKLLDIGC